MRRANWVALVRGSSKKAGLTALLFIAILGIALTIWTLYYQYAYYRCHKAPSPTACEQWLPLERFACDHELPDTWVMRSCGQLAARHFLGVGRPKDQAQAIPFFRRDCVSSIWGDVGSCVMTWGYYTDAYFEPHYVMGWSGRFKGPDYLPHWARPVDDVMRDAEAACASRFAGDGYDPKKVELLHQTFCSELPVAKGARDDAARGAKDLLRRCTAGNENACHLAGFVVGFGIGVPRQVQRGRDLLKRACELGSTMACEQSAKGDTFAKALDRIDAASAIPAR
jgi:TPR repeat protein